MRCFQGHSNKKRNIHSRGYQDPGLFGHKIGQQDFDGNELERRFSLNTQSDGSAARTRRLRSIWCVVVVVVVSHISSCPKNLVPVVTKHGIAKNRRKERKYRVHTTGTGSLGRKVFCAKCKTSNSEDKTKSRKKYRQKGQKGEGYKEPQGVVPTLLLSRRVPCRVYTDQAHPRGAWYLGVATRSDGFCLGLCYCRKIQVLLSG